MKTIQKAWHITVVNTEILYIFQYINTNFCISRSCHELINSRTDHMQKKKESKKERMKERKKRKKKEITRKERKRMKQIKSKRKKARKQER